MSASSGETDGERQWEQLLRQDLRSFRAGTYRQVLWITGAIFWLSSIDACRLEQPTNWPVATSLVLGAGIALSLLLHHTRRRGARLVLAGALSVAYFTTILAYPHVLARFLGIPVLLLCYSMLSPLQSTGVALALVAELIAAELWVPRAANGLLPTLAPMALIAVTLFCSWLSGRHLLLALAWAEQSTYRSQQLTRELQDRQMALNRALRAMDEANERLAASNARLLEARQAAEEARQAKARFAANVSHELRTPLNVIVGLAELMYTAPDAYPGVTMSPQFLADLGAVYRNAQHLQALVDDVLDLSQLEAGRFELMPAETDLGALVEEAVETVRNLAAVRHLNLATNIAADVPIVRIDRTRIKQVFLNLLSNAIRHTERGGITISAQRHGEEVMCSVTDTGRGIPPEKQQRLFREFEHMAAAPGRQREGSGLGLSISKRFVEQHGGRMWVESKPGEGSSFIFTLPVSHARAIPGTPTAAVSARRVLPRHGRDDQSVLLVTGNPTAVRLIDRLMKGYRCVATASVEQAIHQIAELQPRGILVDAGLGDEQVALVVGAAERAGISHIPVVICPMPQLMSLPAQARVQAYLSKPITRQALHDALRPIGENIETVLIVDDDENLVRLLTHYLRDDPARPYKTLAALNGAEALSIMSQHRPDLVLLDLRMPVMDGWQVLEAMAASSQLAGIPVVILSGQDALDGGVRVAGWAQLAIPRGMGFDRLVRAINRLLLALQEEDGLGRAGATDDERG